MPASSGDQDGFPRYIARFDQASWVNILLVEGGAEPGPRNSDVILNVVHFEIAVGQRASNRARRYLDRDRGFPMGKFSHSRLD